MSGHANIAVFVPHQGCPHRCSFCDQRAISGNRQPPGPGEVRQTLVDALARMGERARKAEIAFFGGSFTAIPPAQRRALLEAAAPFVGRGGFRGIRVSTRPDAVDQERLEELRAHGATTVELGAQSMDGAVLRRNRRGHTPADVERAARLVKEQGFALGLQMMTGLPGDSDAGARKTAGRLAALEPDCVRIYPTLVLRGTGLEAMLRQGSYQPPGLEETVALCAGLLAFFRRREIPVIRLGLHDAPALRGQLVAGPHHPALRELCEGRLLLEQVLARLGGNNSGGGRELLLRVHPRCVSWMTGQRRANLRALEAAGWRAAVQADETIPFLEVEPEFGPLSADTYIC